MSSQARSEDALNSENTLLLFDGLDEVADEPMRNRLFEAVADLMQTYAAPRVVVSSRPYAFCKERSPIDLALFERCRSIVESANVL